VRPCGDGWSARCPAHNDHQNSLSIGVGDDDRALIFCHGGCAIDDVVAELGLSMHHLFQGGSRRRRALRHARPKGSRPTPNARNWGKLAIHYQHNLTRPVLNRLARDLGVSPESLLDLGVGYSEVERAWTFPERDGGGEVIGILRRFRDGKKRAMKGGRRGIYVPASWRADFGETLVPEGPSDVAALLTVGLRAVGRPSCTGGIDHLIRLFSGTNDKVCVLGENDRKEDGRWPGRDGARSTAARLRRELGRRVSWAMLPEGAKDVRDHLAQEGLIHVSRD
jgi:hypothetical protein